jgi:hypothetical protein
LLVSFRAGDDEIRLVLAGTAKPEDELVMLINASSNSKTSGIARTIHNIAITLLVDGRLCTKFRAKEFGRVGGRG